MGLCRATRKDGRACTALAGPSGYCFGHDPGRAEAHKRGRKAGGEGRSTLRRAIKLLPGDMRSLLGALTQALEEVHQETLEPSAGRAMASLATAMVRVYDMGELTLRVKRLEERDEPEEEAPGDRRQGTRDFLTPSA
jgi:hypothetical protein